MRRLTQSVVLGRFLATESFNPDVTNRLCGLDRRFVNQHDGNVIPHRIHAQAYGTFEGFRRRAVGERFLARRTDQHREQILGNHILTF